MTEVESVTIEVVDTPISIVEVGVQSADIVEIDTGNYIRSDGSVTKIVQITQEEYDALDPPVPQTYYIIVG